MLARTAAECVMEDLRKVLTNVPAEREFRSREGKT
jgi:hypothetical protein